MGVTIVAKGVQVDVECNGESYSPDVMNDLCARALSLTLEIHRELAAAKVVR